MLHSLSGISTLQDLAAADQCLGPVLSLSDDEWSLVETIPWATGVRAETYRPG